MLPLLAALLPAACGGAGSSPVGPAGPPPTDVADRVPVGAITRGPYLQHSDTGTRVVWYTETPTEGRLRWFSEERGGEVLCGETGTRHEAVIDATTPASRYGYRLYSSRGLLGREDTVEFSFRTPDPERLRLVVFGDSGIGSPEQHAVARAIAAEALPDLVMIVGDVIYPPADDASYEPRFFSPYRSLLPATTFYAAPGNHDYEVLGGKPFFDVFTLPRNGPPGLLPESSYHLERAGTQLIVHDTNQPTAALRNHSLPWHAQLARRPASFRLVFQHHTMYSSGQNFSQPPAGTLRKLLAPAYAASGVDVVFNGHDHLYERTRPLDGVVYVTTGAGGAPLYARTAQNAFTAAFFNDRHSFTQVEVDGRRLALRQIDLDGREVDALTLTKPVAAADALRTFAGSGEPPRGWQDPGFDDSSWAEPHAEGFARTLHARRAFELARPGEVEVAFLRVGGAADYVVRLNGVEVARGGGAGDPEPGLFPVAASLLRAGGNALSLEGQLTGQEAGSPPSLELVLYSSPQRRPR